MLLRCSGSTMSPEPPPAGGTLGEPWGECRCVSPSAEAPESPSGPPVPAAGADPEAGSGICGTDAALAAAASRRIWGGFSPAGAAGRRAFLPLGLSGEGAGLRAAPFFGWVASGAGLTPGRFAFSCLRCAAVGITPGGFAFCCLRCSSVKGGIVGCSWPPPSTTAGVWLEECGPGSGPSVLLKPWPHTRAPVGVAAVGGVAPPDGPPAPV